jgi:hypothetical protein
VIPLDGQYTDIYRADLVRRLAEAKESYLTVLLSGNNAPFDRFSFKISRDQMNDCRLLTDRFDLLTH